MNLLTNDDIRRIQDEILKKEAKKGKKSVYNNKDNGISIIMLF